MSSDYHNWDQDEEWDERMAAADAEIEDTIHCSLCYRGFRVDMPEDGVTLELPKDQAVFLHPPQLKLCRRCARYVGYVCHLLIGDDIGDSHGHRFDEWCEVCCVEYEELVTLLKKTKSEHKEQQS